MSDLPSKGLSAPAASPQHPVIRRLWLVERKHWQEHLLRLSPDARRKRFAGVVSNGFIKDYCEQTDFSDARFIGCFVDGVLRGVGEFRPLGKAWPKQAELAFSVEDAFQGRGIGSELFRRMINLARNRGVKRVFVVSESSNDRMRHIARRYRMVTTVDHGEDEGRIELFWLSYASVMEEMLDEGTALMRSMHGAMGIR